MTDDTGRREWWIESPPWCWKPCVVSTFPKSVKSPSYDPTIEVIHVREVLPDDPNPDALIAAAIEVLRASSRGDQNFIECLCGDDATRLRIALVTLADVFNSEGALE